MSIRRRFFAGGMALATSQGIGMALRFARSIVVARLVSPADFGIAATLAVTMAFLDMISYLGTEVLIVQATGAEP